MQCITLNKRFCVYIDLTQEENPRCFYVGKGTVTRVNFFKPRNSIHKRISAKYGLQRIVVFETDLEQEAFDEEIRLIRHYKTFVHGGIDCWGANFTRGGEGSTGYIYTTQQRQNVSQGIKRAHQLNSNLSNVISIRQKRLMSDAIHVEKISNGIKRAFKMMSIEKRQIMRSKIAAARRGKPSSMRGSRSPKTSLTEKDVRSIKIEFLRIMFHGIESGVRGAHTKTCISLSNSFQVSYRTIYKIVSGATWNHIKVSYHDKSI